MQNYTWPSVSVQATNPSVGINGAPIPGSSTLIGGKGPTGNETPVSVDASGNINTNVVNAVLPTGSATAANQVLEIAQLTGIHSDTTSLDGKTVHVDTGNVTVSASALPTGASTSALQTSTEAILNSRLSGSLVPGAYDEIDLSYTGSNLTQAVYKLAGTTIKTLTLSYTGSQLNSVVAS